MDSETMWKLISESKDDRIAQDLGVAVASGVASASVSV
jgi:hypothetical protein